MKTKIIYKSCISVSIEVENDSRYFNDFCFDVFLNGELYIKNETKNVFSIYGLKSDYEYLVTFSDQRLEKISFKTDYVSCILNVRDFNAYGDGIHDDTLAIQTAINVCPKEGMVLIPEGNFLVNSLFLKSNITLYLCNGSNIIANNNSYESAMYPDSINTYGVDKVIGTWEGEKERTYISVLNLYELINVNIIGEGKIDAKGDFWWNEVKNKRLRCRPKLMYVAYSNNVNIQGIVFINSSSWTIHLFYSSYINVIDVKVNNPKDSINTDACNPESCDNVNIIGSYFSVGDDCIAIKSGKLDMAKNYYKECKNINIRNCYMKDGHGAVVIGSEMSCGVRNIDVSKCIFDSTDRGFRVKTRRGRGEYAQVNNASFKNILMKNVLNPFVINMYYFCDVDGKTEYVSRKDIKEVKDDIPYLNSFCFEDIDCIDTLISAGFFYGLSERFIENIKLKNINISFANSNLYDFPAMMDGIERVNRQGFYFNSIKKVEIENVKIENVRGEKYIFENVNEIKGDNLYG